MPILWLVIPCYNEEEVLLTTSGELKREMDQLLKSGKIDPKSRIIFVNDGSGDSTWPIIKKLNAENSLFGGICLSRNYGHQNALLAGLMTAKEHADICISMDADLQDDVTIIKSFVDEYEKGNDIVYGVRASRKMDSFFKRNTAQLFYRFMAKLGVELVYNHAECRLLSKRALQHLAEFEEVNIFLRGIIPRLGYPSSQIAYERKKRAAGESKYPLKKMLKFAFEGITSFSVKPIRMITAIGGFMLMICAFMIAYFLVRYFTGNTVSGWTSLIISIWTLGSIQLLSIGVIGEYIGKTYMESKHRPKYIIETVLNDTEKI